MSTDKRRRHCPKCHNNISLWQGATISGWVNVNEYLEEQKGTLETDYTWYDLDDQFGCGECGWEGVRSGLIELGIDDKPLPVIHPNQLRLGEAA